MRSLSRVAFVEPLGRVIKNEGKRKKKGKLLEIRSAYPPIYAPHFPTLVSPDKPSRRLVRVHRQTVWRLEAGEGLGRGGGFGLFPYPCRASS